MLVFFFGGVHLLYERLWIGSHENGRGNPIFLQYFFGFYDFSPWWASLCRCLVNFDGFLLNGAFFGWVGNMQNTFLSFRISPMKKGNWFRNPRWCDTPFFRRFLEVPKCSIWRSDPPFFLHKVPLRRLLLFQHQSNYERRLKAHMEPSGIAVGGWTTNALLHFHGKFWM